MPDNIASSTCILDNGANYAKVGLAGWDAPRFIPNCIMKVRSERRRAFIGNQIEDCRDVSGVFYLLGCQKGYIVNWDTQKTVWDHIFSPDCTSINLCDKTLLITEPPFNFTSIQEITTEIFFEEYDCESLYRTTTADLVAYNYFKGLTATSESATYSCCIVLDIGYSFTHIIPFVGGQRIKNGIRRIDIGGKVLTNHLKELISYRHLNVMDESYVVNQIKEDTCFVSLNFKEDMLTSGKKYPTNTIIKEYVLPDFTTVKRGYLRNLGEKSVEQQTLRMNNERFTIPEILFHPSDVGINQLGISEAVIDCLQDVLPAYHHLLLANIIVVGGCSLFPGMRERLFKDIRCLVPEDMEVNITLPENPMSYAWEGGKKLSQSSDFRENVICREEYEEQGVRVSLEKFDI